MSFGRTRKLFENGPKKEFCPYKFCKERWGLTRDQIVSVKKKRTYKNFMEYQVSWKSNTGEGTHIFKMIINDTMEKLK